MNAPTLATHWMIVANSTLNEAVSHDTYHPIWKKFVTNLLNFRQSLSCTVCKGILEEAYTPIPSSYDQDCQHHACKACLGKKKSLKPPCSWCRDYEKYVRCTIIDTHVRSYENLCEYLRQSRQYAIIKNEKIVDLTCSISLPDSLQDSRGLCVEKLVNEIMMMSGGGGIGVIRDQALSQIKEDPCDLSDENSDSRSEELEEPEFKLFGDLGSPSGLCADVKCDESFSFYPLHDDIYIKTESFFDEQLNTDTDVDFGQTLDTFMLPEDLPEPQVEEPSTSSVTHFPTSTVQLDQPPILSNHTVLLSINAQGLLDQNALENGLALAPVNSVRRQHSGKSNKARKGCRCGTATNNPGTLTCCGQRCPCYVEAKECVDCKCRGCRNPYRSGGRKVRPHIVPTENIQVHFPPSPKQFVRGGREAHGLPGVTSKLPTVYLTGVMDPSSEGGNVDWLKLNCADPLVPQTPSAADVTWYQLPQT
ncbi:unnamed protein product [Notodromas monacha]|uniref:Uncharacterized protein n=1 Tax=Notodromas monacha TaxID=399045 RepID=A0A7R9BGZ1_9CRUS|nr:unnamed protein product [Notodromas monacha]CAG0915283.1 unnamed protein product [Notodromas monacha]